MKNRRILAIMFVVLLLLSTMTGCGAAEMSAGNAAYDAEYENVSEAVGEDGLSKTEQSSGTTAPVNQKLIRKVYMDAETEDMDSLLYQVEQRISELGGYVESREVYNGSTRYTRSRHADMTIRIPAESLDQFVNQVSEVSNITSLRETADDVTLSYVATQSRITALETEETRLLELLAKAETMEDLLLIESKLTDIRTDLEEVKSRLKLYDNQVSYGTIYLNVSEVKEYTEVEEEPEGFFARIGKGFMESAKDLWNGLLELVIFLISNLPYFLFLGLIALAIILPVCAHRKKKKKKEDKAA